MDQADARHPPASRRRSTTQRSLTRRPRVDPQLLTISLLGAVHGLHADTEIASAAVEATIRSPNRYRLWLAIAKGLGGDASYAVQQLERHEIEQPHDDRSKVKLALAMMLGRHPDWKRVVQQVLALSTDVAARRVATDLLSFPERFRFFSSLKK